LPTREEIWEALQAVPPGTSLKRVSGWIWDPKGTPCVMCGSSTARRAITCSRSCGQQLNVLKRDPAVEAARRAKIATRMKVVRTEIPNPMDDPEVRARMSATLRERGHAPPVRGGNGRGPTECEALLWTALDAGPTGPWVLNHIVPNGQGSRARGLPSHYKIDIASPPKKLAIEVDGFSHSSMERREQDARKTSTLIGYGWTVLRFTNKQVKTELQSALDTVQANW
jgi:hypothetical protein